MFFKNPEDFPQSIDRCAYYGRVSTPKQHIEHQRDHVLRFAEEHAINLPADRIFEDAGKRHKSAQRKNFQRLLDLCRKGEIDWIIVCAFDRWGVSDIDEFFEFRRLLKGVGVRVWSVVDSINLLSLEEGDYFRLVALAVGASRYVEQMAEKNILKMVTMAENGWAASGNAPFGTDLVCYRLHDLQNPLFRVVRLRVKDPHLFKIIQADGTEEVSERMPARDKKTTGYRLEPSICEERIRAVNLIFELFETGMSHAKISDNLWNQGLKHYDKPFSHNAIETILKNPAYIGHPAWGKVGVGYYLHLLDGKPTKPKRKPNTRQTVPKASDAVSAIEPVFEPIVPVDLFRRIQERLESRSATNPAFGKVRTRDRIKHPLNGKLVCPDCGKPMVLGSSMSKGYCKRYFICGTYRKTGRKQCSANSIPWDKVDDATDCLLETVKDRLDQLSGAKPVSATLLKQDWVKQSEIGRIFVQIVEEAGGDGQQRFLASSYVKNTLKPESEEFPEAFEESMTKLLEKAVEVYSIKFRVSSSDAQDELESINAELDRIAQAIMDGVASKTVRDKLNARAAELEQKKTQLELKLVPLTTTLLGLLEQLEAIRKTIIEGTEADRAALLDAFLETVVPHFQGEATKGHGRDIEFEFRPKDSGRKFMPESMRVAMKEGDAPRDTAIFHWMASAFETLVFSGSSKVAV
jgi:predicted site-specific integrase-resolvase